MAFLIIAGFAAFHFFNRPHHRLIIPISSPFAPGAGERQSLPPLVLDVSRLAARHNLRQLSLSKELREKAGGHLLEFLYPIRIVSESDYIFALAHENRPDRGCRADISGEIAFYDCRIK